MKHRTKDPGDLFYPLTFILTAPLNTLTSHSKTMRVNLLLLQPSAHFTLSNRLQSQGFQGLGLGQGLCNNPAKPFSSKLGKSCHYGLNFVHNGSVMLKEEAEQAKGCRTDWNTQTRVVFTSTQYSDFCPYCETKMKMNIIALFTVAIYVKTDWDQRLLCLKAELLLF